MRCSLVAKRSHFLALIFQVRCIRISYTTPQQSQPPLYCFKHQSVVTMLLGAMLEQERKRLLLSMS
jgi:hypothetical protein